MPGLALIDQRFADQQLDVLQPVPGGGVLPAKAADALEPLGQGVLQHAGDELVREDAVRGPQPILSCWRRTEWNSITRS